MDTKHSPGPWRLHDWSSHDRDGAMEASGSQVVDANGHMVSACFIEGASESEEADAHLIAAAPDLLEALVEMERQADLSLDYRPEFRRAIASAHAAIAKATGSAA